MKERIMEKQIIEAIKPEIINAMTTTVREKTWDAVYKISELIKPGTTESEAKKLATEYFFEQGVERFWHKPHVRFGSSTVLSFHDLYKDEVILGENDIFYIDVGPVWNGIEGDCGKTFVLGDNKEYHKIVESVETLFKETVNFWHKKKPSGIHLQEFVNRTTEKMGYLLHPTYVKGHRLSDYSHVNYSTKSLYDLDFIPSTERWVLEMQLCDKSMRFGAFYEDILIFTEE